jgi:hypothetical protein
MIKDNVPFYQVWWHTPVIQALGKLNQEHLEFQANKGAQLSEPHFQSILLWLV